MMGYHEHSNTWTPIVGEVLRCQIEPENDVDKYAAAVMNKLQLRASRKKRKVSKNSILFPESRCYQFSKSNNKWKNC